MAQRVGAIVNYRKEEKRATFEVIPAGMDKGYKCSVFLQTGKDWDEDARAFASHEPNPLIDFLDNLTAAKMQGPWKVEGVEKWVEARGTRPGFRSFNVNNIVEASSGDQNIFDMDKDGNEVTEQPQVTGAQNGPAPRSGGFDENFTAARWALSAAVELKVAGYKLDDEIIGAAAQVLAAARDLAKPPAPSAPPKGEPSESSSEPSQEVKDAFS